MLILFIVKTKDIVIYYNVSFWVSIITLTVCYNYHSSESSQEFFYYLIHNEMYQLMQSYN